MPFGGGGALHVCAMMREVGVATGLVPRYPGVSSALGCAIADMRHDFVRTLNRPLAQLDVAALRGSIDGFERAGRAALSASGIDFASVTGTVELDMLYQGQTHTVAVPLSGGSALDAGAIVAAFEGAYRGAFGRTLAGVPMRVLNLRVSVIGERRRFDLAVLAPRGASRTQPIGRRRVFHAGAWHDAPVYDRLALPVGAALDGPALLEQADTSIWIEPGFGARVDALGNLIIERR